MRKIQSSPHISSGEIEVQTKGEVIGSIPINGSQPFENQITSAVIHYIGMLYYCMNMSMPKKARKPCLQCGKEPERSYYKYCSNACQAEYQHHEHIRAWKAGTITGLQSLGIVSRPVKRYLREKYGDKCCQCGWSEVHPLTCVVPLVADHIDGDWRNNREENLRLLCPNCDALTPTFAALNKGRGRKHRAPSRRASEARQLLRK